MLQINAPELPLDWPYTAHLLAHIHNLHLYVVRTCLRHTRICMQTLLLFAVDSLGILTLVATGKMQLNFVPKYVCDIAERMHGSFGDECRPH